MHIRGTVPAADDLEGIRNLLDGQHKNDDADDLFPHSVLESIALFGKARSSQWHARTRTYPLPYIVVYLVEGEAVQILHIHHGAQDWR